MRLIPAPKIGRWHLWAISLYPAGGERLIGHYRLYWTAQIIARALPRSSSEQARYEVRPVDPEAAAEYRARIGEEP